MVNDALRGHAYQQWFLDYIKQSEHAEQALTEARAENDEAIGEWRGRLSDVEEQLHSTTEAHNGLVAEHARLMQKCDALRDAKADVSRTNERENEKPPEEPAKPVAHGPGCAHFYCGACGPHVRVDEDGCCATCGEETKIEFCRCELKPVAQQDEQEERLRRILEHCEDMGMGAFGSQLVAYLREERRRTP